MSLVAGGGIAWATGGLDEILPAASPAPEPCAATTSIDVVADPSVVPVLRAVAKRFDADERCVETRVRAEDSADTASVLAAGGDVHADVWVPDSTAWRQRMDATSASLGRPISVADFGEPVATTPIVFAAPATQSAVLAAASLGWGSVLAGDVPVLLPDPEGSAASLAALGALGAHAPAEDPRRFAGAMIALGKTIPRSLDAALAAAQQAEAPTVVVTTEQAITAENRRSPDEQFFAIYPSDGTTALAYPFVRVAGAATLDEDRDAVVDDVEAAIRNAPDLVARWGFRTGAGSGDLDDAGVLAAPVEVIPGADGAAQLGILRTWGVLTLRSRMLAVIDVSGSMEEPSESGLRRIDIFQQAAQGAMQKFSGEVELGVWVFSTRRAGEQDWEDLAPIAPLGDAAHSQQIAAIIASLPDRLGGATGLYDTTLAAVQRVRESYDPSKVNSVLVITDGRNEDENGSSLDELLASLAAQADPDRPVPVILIGFGPDTDLDAMTRIAKSTGGAAYSASRPEDLGNVLVDALSQRSCRPDC
ncbi:MAG: VWA domain-containing protein [Leifsonia sp.]